MFIHQEHKSEHFYRNLKRYMLARMYTGKQCTDLRYSTITLELTLINIGEPPRLDVTLSVRFDDPVGNI